MSACCRSRRRRADSWRSRSIAFLQALRYNHAAVTPWVSDFRSSPPAWQTRPGLFLQRRTHCSPAVGCSVDEPDMPFHQSGKRVFVTIESIGIQQSPVVVHTQSITEPSATTGKVLFGKGNVFAIGLRCGRSNARSWLQFPKIQGRPTNLWGLSFTVWVTCRGEDGPTDPNRRSLSRQPLRFEPQLTTNNEELTE